MLVPAMFDATQPLVASRFFEAHEMNVHPGDPIKLAALGDDRKEGELETDTAIRLWLVGYLVYEKDYRPTPMETAQDEAQRLVTMEDVGGGWFLLTTPWGGEGEKVQGREAAEARRSELVAKGDTKGVAITGGDGGWYSITAPWLDEPVKVQGREAAEVEEAMLIEDGPPEGWVPETAEEKAARLQIAADREAARLATEKADAEAKEEADRLAKEAAARDQAAADEQAAQVARAAALEAAGIVITTKGGGYYELTAPNLAEPIKVRGKDAADVEADRLLAAPPAPAQVEGDADEGATETVPAETTHQDGAETPAQGEGQDA